MKKVLAVVLAALLTISMVACAKAPAAPFEVGKDTATYKVEGASDWAGTVTANVKIVAGDDVLFNGAVTVTSDSLYACEFVYAAVLEKGLSQAGIQEGFITNIGNYSNEDPNYWMWYYQGNNPTNFAINDVHVFAGDYILVSYETVQW